MEYFRRILGYVKAQYRLVVLSILCAVLVAGLFSLSLAAMLPLMKVIINEEGLHGWIGRAVVRDRSGIDFEPLPLAERMASGGHRPIGWDRLRVGSVETDSTAKGSGIQAGDVVVTVEGPDGTMKAESGREEILQLLAEVGTGQPIKIEVEHFTDGERKTVELVLKEPPFYTDAADWLLGFVPREGGKEFQRKSIILIIGLILAATMLRCFLRFGQEYLIRLVSFRSISRLRADAYGSAIRLPLLHYTTEGVSDTLSRFVQDSNRINTGITTCLGKLIREPFKILSLALVAFSIDVQLTLIVLAGAPIAAMVIGKLGRKMRRATRRTLESWSVLLGRLRDSLSGIRVVKGYHQEEYEEEQFSRVNEKLLKQQFRVGKIDAASGPLLESLGMVAACAGMIGATYWVTEGRLATSDFFTLVMVLGAMADAGRKLGDVYPRLQTANAAAERVYRLIDTPGEKVAKGAQNLGRLQDSLELRGVSFTYPGGAEPALRGVDLQVPAGETVAIVGPNGSGKTTLTSLIPRFFDPDEGQVLIDGVDISQVTLASLREQIGIVTQQTVMFNDTIRANIAYGKSGAEDGEIVAAAKQAYADEFIRATSEGYETMVGEQGATLSGGQLQRLAIARAILRDPAILIFDEAMSQIDADSEAKIQKAIWEFSQGRTSFIIAHRLSTIINADRIVVLDKGEVVGQGSHKELLEQCRLYRQLYEMQFVGV